MKILEYLKKLRLWHFFRVRKEFLELQDEFIEMQEFLIETQDALGETQKSILTFVDAFHENELLMRNDMRLIFNEISNKAKPKKPAKKNGTGNMYG